MVRWRNVGWLAVLALFLATAASNSKAISIDFEDPVSGSDTAAGGFEGVSIAGGLVLSEAFIELLTLHSAVGTWATSGDQGAFNSLSPSFVFTFDTPVFEFSLNVLALPLVDAQVAVLLQAFDANGLLDEILSDPNQIGDSGLHEDHLGVVEGGITRVEVQAVSIRACGLPPCYDPLGRDQVWIDDVAFSVIPEPAAVWLLLGGLVGMGWIRWSR